MRLIEDLIPAFAGGAIASSAIASTPYGADVVGDIAVAGMVGIFGIEIARAIWSGYTGDRYTDPDGDPNEDEGRADPINLIGKPERSEIPTPDDFDPEDLELGAGVFVGADDVEYTPIESEFIVGECPRCEIGPLTYAGDRRDRYRCYRCGGRWIDEPDGAEIIPPTERTIVDDAETVDVDFDDAVEQRVEEILENVRGQIREDDHESR